MPDSVDEHDSLVFDDLVDDLVVTASGGVERFELAEKELGGFKSFEVAGTWDPGTGPVTYVEGIFKKGTRYWRITWQGDAVRSVRHAGRHPPFEATLAGQGEEYSGASIAGRHPLRITFRRQRKKLKALVLEPVPDHPAKKLDCKRK